MPLQILMEEELEREAGLKREEISALIKEEKESALLDGDRWKTVSISAMAGLAFFGWLWMSVLEPRLNWFGARGPSSADSGSVEEARGDQSSYLHADTNLVKFVQSRLKQLGFRVGSVDGVVGPRTMEALERFQMSQGLLVTGVIDRKTKEALDKLNLPKGKSEPYQVARARREKFQSGTRFIVDLSMDPALSWKGVEKHVRRVTVRYAKANPDVKRFHVRGYLGIASLSAGAYAIADWNRKGKDVSALQGFDIRFQEWVRKDIVGTLPPPLREESRRPGIDARVGGDSFAAPENTRKEGPLLNLGIVGLGAIGRTVCRAVVAGGEGGGEFRARVAAVTSRDRAKAEDFLRALGGSPPPWMPLEDLIARSDLVVEAAGGPVVPSLAEAVFDAEKGLMVISVGAFLSRPDLVERARREGRRLYIPTGALAGLDGVKSAMAGRVDRVVMTTRKPPRGLAGAPHLVRNNISLDGLREPKVVFEGSALEALRGFPENVNVCAGLSLAGIGPEKTRIRVIADPGIERNMHTYEVVGEAGRMTVQIENIPTENPKTGRLTAMAIIAGLREIADSLHVGT